MGVSEISEDKIIITFNNITKIYLFSRFLLEYTGFGEDLLQVLPIKR